MNTQPTFYRIETLKDGKTEERNMRNDELVEYLTNRTVISVNPIVNGSEDVIQENIYKAISLLTISAAHNLNLNNHECSMHLKVGLQSAIDFINRSIDELRNIEDFLAVNPHITQG